MEDNNIKGIKIRFKKRSLIAWIACVAICIVAFGATLGCFIGKYAEYCKAQDVAIETTISILPKFKKYDTYAGQNHKIYFYTFKDFSVKIRRINVKSNGTGKRCWNITRRQ